MFETIYNSISLKMLVVFSLATSSICAFCIAYRYFRIGKRQGRNGDFATRKLHSVIFFRPFMLGLILFLVSAMTLGIAVCLLTIAPQSTNQVQVALPFTRSDTTSVKSDSDSTYAQGAQLLSQKQSLLFEYIKTRIQTNNDDAQAILLYGTISLGVIVLLLPVYIVEKARPWYWIILSAGTILLAGGAFGTISYSRQQVAWSDRKLGPFFKNAIMECNQDSSVFSVLNKFNKDHPPYFKEGKGVLKASQCAIITGGLLYAFLFTYGMIYSAIHNKSFFSKKG